MIDDTNISPLETLNNNQVAFDQEVEVSSLEPKGSVGSVPQSFVVRRSERNRKIPDRWTYNN